MQDFGSSFKYNAPATTLPPAVPIAAVTPTPLMAPAVPSKPPSDGLAAALAKGSGGGSDSSGDGSLKGGASSSLGGNKGGTGGGGNPNMKGGTPANKALTGDAWRAKVHADNEAWQKQPHEATKALDTELRADDQRRLDDEAGMAGLMASSREGPFEVDAFEGPYYGGDEGLSNYESDYGGGGNGEDEDYTGPTGLGDGGDWE